MSYDSWKTTPPPEEAPRYTTACPCCGDHDECSCDLDDVVDPGCPSLDPDPIMWVQPGLWVAV